MEGSPESENLFNRASPQTSSNSNSPNKDVPVVLPSWTKILLLAGIVTTIGSSLPVGYNIGVVNSPADVIKEFCNQSVYSRYNKILNQSELDLLWSCIVSIFLVGGTIGSLSGSVFADTVGRKGALVVSSIIGALGGIFFYCCKPSNSVEMLLLGRLLVGTSSGLITSVMPMYLTELAPKNLSGSTGVLCPLGVTIGVLLGQIMSLSQILGNVRYWPHLLALFVLPLVLCLIVLVIFLPESPKYLYVIKKQPELALRQLARIRDVREELLSSEVQELRLEKQDNDGSGHEGDSWNICSVLRDKQLLLPLLLVCGLQAGQQFSGINAVFYYSVSIFQKAGLSLQNSQLATIAAGCCNLFMAIISIPVMAKYNRRTTLQISLSTTAFFLTLLGVATILISRITWMPYLSIVGVLGFVVCYGIALGPVPYFIGSELFEVGPRPSAMALGSMANWGGNFCVALCFPLMQLHLGAASFFIFAVVVVALFFFVRIYMPETRNRGPIEVALLCRNGLKSRPLESPISSQSTAESPVIYD